MDQILSVAYVPFTFALALMAALLGLEIVTMLLGFSLQGHDADLDISPEIAELQAHFDLNADASPDLTHLLETSDSLQTHEAAEVDRGFAALIGLQNMPLMIWLAALLFSFGTAGFMVQKLTGGLPIWLAVALAAMAALAFTRTFARGFARLVPKFETTATSVQFMGGLRGVVTQGTARVGAAAEVKLRDRHGNLHFVRCEPFSVEDQIVEGTEVLTLRKRLGPDRWSLTILSVS